MYQYLREEAKRNANIGPIDYTSLFKGKTALDVLRITVGGYFNMNKQEHLLNFYKVIYSERTLQPMAAQIMVEETEKMINATKQLFYAMQVHQLLYFDNPDMSALSFALSVHGLMEYALDQTNAGNEASNKLDEYLQWFAKENEVK